MLQNRLKQLRDEEEARIEAEEVSKAAERFKDVGSELNEWEEKHGNGTSGTSVQGASGGPVTPHNRSSVALPQLGFTEDRRLSSESLLPAIGDRGAYDIVPLSSPTLLSADAPTTGRFSMMDSLKSPDAQVATALTDPELEDKIRLLAEVKRAREEVKGSLDKLRSSNPTPSMTGLLAETPGMTTPSPGGSDFASTHPRLSVASSRMLDYPERSQTPNQGEWEAYLQERKVLSRPALPSPALLASSAVASAPSSQHSQYAVISDGCGRAAERRERTTSMLEPRASDFGSRQSRGMSNTYPSSSVAMRKTASFKDWPSTFHDVPFGQPIILGSAARPMEPTTSNRPKQQRTMTYDELAERHRKRISQLQEPVTAKMREQVDVAEAKARWEQQKRRERNEQQCREQEQASRRDAEGKLGMEEKQEILRTTDEWRRSVVTGPDGCTVNPTPRPPKRMSSQGFAS